MFIAPDWRDAGAYRQLERATLRTIAWEFLRRCPKYQQAWANFARELRAYVAGDDSLAAYAEYLLLPSADQLREGPGSPRARWTDEEHAALQERLEYGLETSDDEVRDWGLWTALERRHGRPVGVARIFNPQSRPWMLDPEFLGDEFGVHAPVSSFGGGVLDLGKMAKADGAATLSQSKWLVLRVDLSAPAEVIKTDVMDWIKRQRDFRVKRGFVTPVAKRAQKNPTYVEYMRILDGVAAGEEITRVGAVLAPHEHNAAPDRPRDKRFRAALRTANSLRDGGYRSLLRLESRQVRKKK